MASTNGVVRVIASGSPIPTVYAMSATREGLIPPGAVEGAESVFTLAPGVYNFVAIVTVSTTVGAKSDVKVAAGSDQTVDIATTGG